MHSRSETFRRLHFLGVRAAVSCLCVVLLACSTVVNAQTTGTVDYEDIYKRFRKVREHRGNLEYQKSIEILKSILHECENEGVLKRAYNDLVHTLLSIPDSSMAEATAKQALARFPEISADTASFPLFVNQFYDRVRKSTFGSLLINTRPSGCHVFVGETLRGKSPLDLSSIPADRYEVIVIKKGHFRETFNIEVAANRRTTMEIILEKRVRFVTRSRVRPLIDLGVNNAYLVFDDGFWSSVAGDTKTRIGFSAGVLVDLGLSPNVYFETGLRYVKLGGAVVYHIVTESMESVVINAETILDCLAIPLLIKYHIQGLGGLYLIGGAELGITLQIEQLDFWAIEERRRSPADFGELLDDLLVSIGGGLGFEFGVSDRNVFVQLQFSRGLTGGPLEGARTRELKLSTGLVF